MGTPAPNMERFAAELLRRAPGTRNGGIAPGDPKQGGYHNSRNKLVALGKTGDYSLRYAWDNRGNADRWRAFDWTFPDAQGGNYATIRYYMTRIREAFDRRDPLLTGWREALGQQDADANPEGFDFVTWLMRTPDMSHMWHIHFSIMNEFVDEWWPYENMLTILFGETGGDGDMTPEQEADHIRRQWNIDEGYLNAFANGAETITYFDGANVRRTMPNVLAQRVNRIASDVAEIRATLAAPTEIELPADFEDRVVAKLLDALGGSLEGLLNRTRLSVQDDQ